jgi:hypothetical protein
MPSLELLGVPKQAHLSSLKVWSRGQRRLLSSNSVVYYKNESLICLLHIAASPERPHPAFLSPRKEERIYFKL